MFFSRRVLRILLFGFLLLPSKSMAESPLTCDDVARYEEGKSLNSALSVYLGCLPQEEAQIAESLSTWPLPFQLWARSNFYLKGDQYPSHDEFQGTLPRIIAARYSLNDLISVYLSQHGYFPPSSRKLVDSVTAKRSSDPVEATIQDLIVWWNGFEASDPSEFSPIDILQRFKASDIPALKHAYLWELSSDGGFLAQDETGASDGFRRIYLGGYSDHAHMIEDVIDDPDESLKILNEVSSRGFINARIDYARRLVTDDGLTEPLRDQGSRIIQEMALYGDPHGQYRMAILYDEGWGVKKNYQMVQEWMLKAANSGWPNAIGWIFDEALERGDLNTAFLMSLKNAFYGETSIEDKGYMMAFLLSPHLIQDSLTLNKFQKYLRSHCRQNPSVYDSDACGKILASDINFAKYPNLEVAFADPESMVYQSTVQLNPGRYRALIITNQNYLNWQRLETPIQDGKALGNLLESKYGFQVEYLTDSSRRETLKAIYELGKELEFLDHLLVYYAGHGVIDRDTETAYWVPADAPRNFQPDWISTDEIMNALKTVVARHLLLIADSCYSGKLLRGAEKTDRNPDKVAIERMFAKKARVAITSGGVEPVLDRGSESGHSVFADALIKALSTRDGVIPASALFEEIFGAVTALAQQTPEYSSMKDLGHDGGDFIFSPR